MPSSGDRSRSPRRRKRSASDVEEPEPSRSRRRYDTREGERRHQGHGTTDHADDHRIQQQDEEAAGVSDKPSAARGRSRSPRSRSRDRGRDKGSGRDRDRRRSSSRSRSRERPQQRQEPAADGARERGRTGGWDGSREPQAREGDGRDSRAGGGGSRRRGDRWGYDAYAREEGGGGGGGGAAAADDDAAAAEVRKGRGFTSRRSGRSRSRDRYGGSRGGRDAAERGAADRNGGGREEGRGRWGTAEGDAERRRGSGREREAEGDAAAAAAGSGAPEENGAAAGGAAVPGAAAAGDEAEASDFLKKKAALSGRAGGAYIPPFRLARMMAEIDDKNSAAAQKLSWEALRKSLNGLINKVNAPNIKDILPELFQENLMRGRGIFCQAIMKAQLASPTFSPLYAALISVVNTKFPELGELLCHRVVAQFRRAYKRNDKPITIAAAKFLAHLINQGVLHEVLALEMLILLLENPSDDSVEMAVEFCKEVGAYLQEVAPAGLHSVFERFRAILHEGAIDRRCQYMIEGLFAVRKAGFEASGHPAVQPALDLVEDEDQITHEMSLDDKHDPQAVLNVFREDPEYAAHEAQYHTIVRELLGDEDEEEEGGAGEGSGSGGEESDEEEEQERQQQQQDIEDETGTNLVNLRRTIYLTIMSSLDFEEAGHKLMKIQLAPGQASWQRHAAAVEPEIPIMIIECCSQEKTFVRYYALLGARFCMLRREFQATFEDCFAKQYAIIHRLETNKLRNVAKLFAHLLSVDGISWGVLGCIRLTEDDTTSSSRIFIKYLFQELSEYMGLVKLNQRLAEPSLQEYFGGIFPADSMANMRFSINFFTSIGLGGITDRQRELYKQMPRIMAERRAAEEAARKAAGVNSDSGGSSSSGTSSSSSSGSSSSSSSSSSDSSSSSSSSDSDSDSGDSRRRRRRRS
ncbi:hypothetical protein COO60DRAFT_1697935 [Scenedesmus sp. NREL 46B-D3]|nr:hypothetical protein COO60DRAFT_1697935 [Scenedesmus sp. NREL 46B-D3]